MCETKKILSTDKNIYIYIYIYRKRSYCYTSHTEGCVDRPESPSKTGRIEQTEACLCLT